MVRKFQQCRKAGNEKWKHATRSQHFPSPKGTSASGFLFVHICICALPLGSSKIVQERSWHKHSSDLSYLVNHRHLGSFKSKDVSTGEWVWLLLGMVMYQLDYLHSCRLSFLDLSCYWIYSNIKSHRWWLGSLKMMIVNNVYILFQMIIF